jgi:hypothetical protein
MRRDFCEIFLSIFPCIKLYGNIQIKLCKNSNINDTDNGSPTSIRVSLTPNSISSNINSNSSTRDNRFYYSKEVNKKFLLENSNDAKNQQNQKNYRNMVLLDMPD